MEKLYEIKEALMRELDKSDTARTGELKGGELEAIHMLTDTIKNIDKICMLEEEGGYSQDGEWTADMQGTYGRGSSYANRGEHYVRGHYSRDGGRDGNMGYSSRRDSRVRYSRDGGRSEMMEHIEMAIEAADGQDKETLKRFMRQLENS